MQVIIGCIGLIANSVGVFIFIKIGNVFNLSLAGLAIVDNLSIAALFVQHLVDNVDIFWSCKRGSRGTAQSHLQDQESQSHG